MGAIVAEGKISMDIIIKAFDKIKENEPYAFDVKQIVVNSETLNTLIETIKFYSKNQDDGKLALDIIERFNL